MGSDQETRYEACQGVLEGFGQGHLLRWWGELAAPQRETLLNDIECVPWAVVAPLIRSHVLNKPSMAALGKLEPPAVWPKEPDVERADLYAEAVELGRRRLGEGRVAVMTVAGGQGTRLGVGGPKGKVIVTPVGKRSLFQLFAEMVLAATRRYGAVAPWYIMTSPANHDETVAYFASHAYFGLPREDIFFFTQGQLPVFDFGGRALLDQKDRLSLAPDGHGGALSGLRRSGALDDLERRGIEVLSYFQVDNPLVKPFDPLFIGLHELTESEMSSKVTRKVDDQERVGNVCRRDGRLTVVEYSDFPEELAKARTADGKRAFDAGNLAIHVLDVDFIRRVTESPLSLPFRRAEKAAPYVDEHGLRVEPKSPNAVKLETFIFDVLPLARNPLVLEVDRAEEFSPVKNLTGADSLETSRRDQVRRACRWLEAAGVRMARGPDGEPDVTVAISPLLAMDIEELKSQASRIPRLTAGAEAYLD